MSLHLIKLSVGAGRVADLAAWQAGRLAEATRAGHADELYHITRMVPKRRDELLDGGSIYWVIKGVIRARQKLLDIRPFVDNEGTRRCRLVLDPELVRTERRERRAFQGWRYFESKDAPRDARGAASDDGMPEEMREELEKLGLM